MVKADPTHDYYADLEVPSTADSDTIKKHFRLLAKQYHPDRNPGREIEVIPKFQAIQAAHEILCDPTQKAGYDRDRAKLNQPPPPPLSTYGTNRQPTFKKPAKPPPPPPSDFPPPPKRDPNLNRPFNSSRARPTSGTAEKFAPFTRASPQQWDRAKFEDAAKAETLRNLNNMRGQSNGPPPKVPPRAAPTAPKPPSAAPSPDILHGPGPSPGFPGLSRTNSGRRGFVPSSPVSDEPPAASSAYARVHRSERPPPQAAGFSYPPNVGPSSPPAQRNRPSMSPLRPVRSSGYEDTLRPGLQRSSSRYATNSGERIDINGPGITRSASVRNSPIERRWDESGPFGSRPQSQQQAGFKVPPPRHHSSSPRGRSGGAAFQFSASESSSSEDEPPRSNTRAKATPRRPQMKVNNGHRAFAESEPALTGQYPQNNYNTKIDEKHYNYPPPEPNDQQHRRNFADSVNSTDDASRNTNNAGVRHVHRDDVPVNNHASQPSNGTSGDPHSANNVNSTFSAADWDFNGDNYFRPAEANSRSRSPTKQNRPKLPNRRPGTTSTQNGREEDGATNDDTQAKMPGVRHVSGTAEGLNKAAAFQAGKFSAEDWAERLRNQSKGAPPIPPSRDKAASPNTPAKHPQHHPEVQVEEHPSSPEQPSHPQPATSGSDAMDIDDSVPAPSLAAESHVGRGPSASASRRPSSAGVNLDEFNETAPFKPSATGLSDLGDLQSTLPFDSRAAEELNLHQAPSSGQPGQKLKLPTPPKPVIPPDEMHLTQESWSKYSEKMTEYMDAWNIFNCKMIDHFRTRQTQISLAMYHNWVTAVGDGAAANDFDGLDFVGSDSGKPDSANGMKPKKAGYATYMEWLKQDRVCRTWWEVAFDEHARCMEDLGRIRKEVKLIRAKEFSKTG